MNSKQKRNLFIGYILLFSFIVWGVFFNDNEKEDNTVNTSLSSEQIKILSNSLIILSQDDMLMEEYLKIKELFENDLSYRYMGIDISYRYIFEIKTVSEYKIFLKLISENKQQRVFKIDFSKKEKDFSIKTFSEDYLKVFIPYMNEKLYITIDKKIIVNEIYNLLENSAKQLELINEKLRIKK